MKRLSVTWASLMVVAQIGAVVEADESCIPTKSDYLGPYYISGTLETNALNRMGRPGESLLVTGRILSAASGGRPLAGAKLEVWQTDGAGNYYPQGAGDRADYEPAEIDLRGTLITDIEGRYRFTTVVPGNYFPRPRHFHYRIVAPDHMPLVTQLYISAEGLSHQQGDRCRHAPLEKTAQGFLYNAPDIYLQPID